MEPTKATARGAILVAAWIAVTSLAAARAQVAAGPGTRLDRPLRDHLVVPQTRSFSRTIAGPVRITGVTASVDIVERVATTTLDIDLLNPHRERIEAELIVPVPDDAVVRGFSYRGAASEAHAEVLLKEEARRIYDAIVAQLRDPALLEFVGYNLIRSSVFPVEGNGTQRVRVTYEHLLATEGERVDYVLPRSESLEYTIPWSVSVTVRSRSPLSTVYSPSHRIEAIRKSAGSYAIRTTPDSAQQPGPFRLSYLEEREGVTASLLAYPDPSIGGGYFLLLAGLPSEPASDRSVPGLRREITIVLDRSGSMRGEKLEQVREAALQVLAGLEPGEPFNLVVYNDSIDLFAPSPVPKTPEAVRAAQQWLSSIEARGGTNLHDALLEALGQRPTVNTLPLVLFLTDGLPTVGETSETAIRNLALEANPHRRRIFTFGVGVDVNTPLLEKIAWESRAAATFVLPGEDVELKVARVFRRLAGPVLADVAVTTASPGGGADPGRIRELLPDRIPDLFEGDHLVLLGRYVGEAPLVFEVAGNYLGASRTFRFHFPLDRATPRNAFVPRLWASRKIALLIDAIREMGADGGAVVQPHGDPTHDPRVRELVDEIVRLSTEFGVLTEYTAFLAREGTDLAQREQVVAEAAERLRTRAMGSRSGKASVNQDLNNIQLKGQAWLNGRNQFLDENLNDVAITTVQQVNDRAFYRRGGRWVDSRLVGAGSDPPVGRVVRFGSEEFRALAARLASEGRQGCISLAGDILLVVDGDPVLVKGPSPAPEPGVEGK